MHGKLDGSQDNFGQPWVGLQPSDVQHLLTCDLDPVEKLRHCTLLDGFLARMSHALNQRVRRTLDLEAEGIEISLRPYGWNAVSGRAPPAGAAPPREIGLLFVATAPTQALATEAAKVCNPFFFHFPVGDGKELPSYAFPFSPAEIERGQVFEFHLNHVVETTSPFELVRTRLVWARSAKTPDSLHGADLRANGRARRISVHLRAKTSPQRVAPLLGTFGPPCAGREILEAIIVCSAAGGIQFEKQRRGVLIELTSHRFDLEALPPSEHSCTTVTRSEANHLTVALATLLGG